MNKVDNFLHEELSYKVKGCFFHVFNTLGGGHKEIIYQKALAKTFRVQRIFFEREKSIQVFFEGEKLGVYRPDFLVEKKVIIELKALPFLPKKAESQVFSYLKGSGYELGFLVNFGHTKLEIKRQVCFQKTEQ